MFIFFVIKIKLIQCTFRNARGYRRIEIPVQRNIAKQQSKHKSR